MGVVKNLTCAIPFLNGFFCYRSGNYAISEKSDENRMGLSRDKSDFGPSGLNFEINVFLARYHNVHS